MDEPVPLETEIERLQAALEEVEAERDQYVSVIALGGWAHVVMKIMCTIDGGRRAWSDPIDDQVIAAVVELEDERTRLKRENAVLHAVLTTTANCDRCDVCQNRAAVAMGYAKEGMPT